MILTRADSRRPRRPTTLTQCQGLHFFTSTTTAAVAGQWRYPEAENQKFGVSAAGKRDVSGARTAKPANRRYQIGLERRGHHSDWPRTVNAGAILPGGYLDQLPRCPGSLRPALCLENHPPRPGYRLGQFFIYPILEGSCISPVHAHLPDTISARKVL